MTAGHEAGFELSVDATLAQALASWSDAGHWVAEWDDQWRYVGMSNTVSYAQLADLDTATEKARRDAPAIAVCDIGS